jgi:hypothetical protein
MREEFRLGIGLPEPIPPLAADSGERGVGGSGVPGVCNGIAEAALSGIMGGPLPTLPIRVLLLPARYSSLIDLEGDLVLDSRMFSLILCCFCAPRTFSLDPCISILRCNLRDDIFLLVPDLTLGVACEDPGRILTFPIGCNASASGRGHGAASLAPRRGAAYCE